MTMRELVAGNLSLIDRLQKVGLRLSRKYRHYRQSIIRKIAGHPAEPGGLALAH